MFISKQELDALRSQAAIVGHLQLELDKLKHDLDVDRFVNTSFFGQVRLSRTIREAITSIESRLDQQEKMQKMLFAHLGIEYAKTTEETATGRQEKEVLRKAKRKC